MEHKLIIEINVRFDEPQERKEVVPEIKHQVAQIDPSALQNLLGPVLQALGNVQLNKPPKKEDGKEKRQEKK